MTATTAVGDFATAVDYDFASAEELAQVWRDESDGDFTPEFPRIGWPAGKATTFEIDEDVPPTRELVGVVVAWHKSSRLYLDSFEDAEDGASRRPDAWSTDGKVQIVPAETRVKIDLKNVDRAAQQLPPLPYPSTDLAQCPYNKFIGDDNAAVLPGQTSGKANNEYREIFMVLRDAETIIPYQVSVPASSIKLWDGRGGYANGLITKGVKLASVETVIRVHTEPGPGSVVYAKAEFSRGRRLDPALKPLAIDYSEGVKEFVKVDPFAASRAALAAGNAAPQIGTGEDFGIPAPSQIAAPAAVPAQAQSLDEAFQAATSDAGAQSVADTFGATPVESAPAAAPAPTEPVQEQPAAPAEPEATPAATEEPVAAAAGAEDATDGLDF